MLLFLISGQAADRYSRKLILAACIGLETIGATVLFTLTLTGEIRFALIFGVLVLVGIARAFQAPAQQAIVPILVPKEHFSNAIVWTSLGFTIGRIAGPATAGFLIGFSDRFGFGIEVVYAAVLALLAVSTILTLMIGAISWLMKRSDVPWCSLMLRKISITAACTETSRADSGSSAMMMSGAAASARAIATRCCCPPES